VGVLLVAAEVRLSVGDPGARGVDGQRRDGPRAVLGGGLPEIARGRPRWATATASASGATAG
jgi:hypothetical protein